MKKRFGLSAKMMMPFVVVLVGALGLVGTLAVRSTRASLTQSLEKRAEIVVKMLAGGVADPLSLGEDEILQQLLDRAKSADSDVAYAVLVNAKGDVVATTEGPVKGQAGPRSEFEKTIAQATAFVQAAVPDSDGLFEVAAPVTYKGLGRIGVLRIGVSTRKVQAMARTAAWTTIGVGSLALLVGMFIYVVATRRVTGPLAAAAGRLDELARGDADLTVRLPFTSRDEVGMLARAYNVFLDNLHKLVHDIRDTSTHVGTASHQLSGASTQLSAGAQQHASSLEETAASLEEITGTVKQNADNARHANQLAQGARDTAEAGGRVLSRAVSAMEEISRSSHKISEIISVIDEIAFQTNLLALNAAVEAARAGEQGRGFAVVAAEVRGLAQRSAGAAREIKGLIRESVQKVEDGSTLVSQSGQALDEIVRSVKRVTDIIAEIAAASQEQSQGIDQVNKAVGQMDQVVQSNAAQTEELSSTARLLAGQAADLMALVGRFKLGAVAPGVHAAARVTAEPPADVMPVPPIGAGERRLTGRREPSPTVASTANGRGHKWLDDDAEEF
jgi:methyl-accepting chemotaxis protein